MADNEFDTLGANPNPVPSGIYGFVHHVAENEFFQNRGRSGGQQRLIMSRFS
jgi:hypothetical protein